MKYIEYYRGEICWHVILILWRGVKEFTLKYFGIPISDCVYWLKDRRICWKSNLKELDDLSSDILEKMRDTSYRKAHIKLFTDGLKKVNSFIDKIRKKDFSNLLDKELLLLYRELVKTLKVYGGFTFYPIDGMDIKLEQSIMAKLRGLMKIKLNDKFNEVIFSKEYGILTTPDELTFVNREELAINSLASKKLSGKILEKEAEKIENNFWWVPLSWDRINARTKEDILKKLKEIKNPGRNIAAIKKRVADSKAAKKELEKKYDFDSEMKHLMSVFEDYAFLHDIRKEGQMKCVYYIYRMDDEIGKRKNINPLLLDYAYPEEIEALLENKSINLRELKDRRNSIYFRSYSKDKEEFYSGEDALLQIKKDTEESKEDLEELSGFIASAGFAEGKVKLCLGVKDAKAKMQKGDILVTGMTTPDFVPYMKIAAAILTEEGGATSHAAVISREFKVPCIVGIKKLTKILKDGDFVEVDANNGIARKVS
jgi:phosphoenolpyruvate synthase/pyruvate phosphate dikinase